MNRILTLVVMIAACSPANRADQSEEASGVDDAQANSTVVAPRPTVEPRWRLDTIRDGTRLNLTACSGPTSLACAKEGESALLATTGRVLRRGDTLVIDVPNQSPTLLVDEADEYGVGHRYVYVGFSEALAAHLVQLHLYEGGGFVFVPRATGRIVSLDAMPVLSPSGRRFVTASNDTDAGYSPNRVRIYRSEADSAVLEWELEPELWGPVQPRWLDDSTVVVVRQPGALHPESTVLRVPVTVRRLNSTWVADSAS
jgi:hypothetical protein